MQTTTASTTSLTNKPAEKIRLDKFISSQNNELSRSQVKILIRRGQIVVNGVIVKSSDVKIDPSEDSVKLDGKEISYKRYLYIMLNKPQGVVCSTKDGLSPTVLSLVPDELMRKGLFPAGRLDKDTEGFVLITDDGDLAHRMLSPKSHVPKVYYVELRDEIQPDYKECFLNGITISGGEECLPAEFFEIDGKDKACHLVLHEGMFHQVKKMFEALGNKVTFLKRIQIGGLAPDSELEIGKCKEILHKNVEKLLEHPDFKRIL